MFYKKEHKICNFSIVALHLFVAIFKRNYFFFFLKLAKMRLNYNNNDKLIIFALL